MNVLIVEDDRAVMMLTTAYVKTFGHEVTPATSGEQALKLFDPNTIDLVLMDYMLPDMDGVQTTQRLRETYLEEWFPIIFLTSARGDEDLSRGLAAGGDDYIYKPVTPVVLEAKLKAMERIVSMQSELKRAYTRMEQLSYMDGLTGIFNRRAFEMSMDKEWKRMRRDNNTLALLMMDVDFFKRYNDHYGHQAGDDCLKQIAKALQDSLLRPADIVGRYGGEEFAVILPATELGGAAGVAQRLLDAVHQLNIPHEKSDISDRASISIGVAISSSRKNNNIPKLIKAADEALYAAKNAGRNQFYPVIDSVV